MVSLIAVELGYRRKIGGCVVIPNVALKKTFPVQQGSNTPNFVIHTKRREGGGQY